MDRDKFILCTPNTQHTGLILVEKSVLTWQDNIKMYLQKIRHEGVEWSQLAEMEFSGESHIPKIV
jgi:hypothetical protein